MATRNSHLAYAMKLRARAAECRALSRLVKERQLASQYLDLADSYERMASTEEHLAERLTPIDLPPSPASEPAPRDE